jgi:ABC-type uncharacterized transport system substrate-binding protein
MKRLIKLMTTGIVIVLIVFLMGTHADAKFYTQTFARILHGAKPGDLPQKFESPLNLVVNLESAKKIGFRIPIDILAGAFEIHETIQIPADKK